MATQIGIELENTCIDCGLFYCHCDDRCRICKRKMMPTDKTREPVLFPCTCESNKTMMDYADFMFFTLENDFDVKERVPVEHELKCEIEFISSINNGEKLFECRKDDRNFRVGDKLILIGYESFNKVVTGIKITCLVTSVLQGERFGIQKGFVVMGIKIIKS